VPSAHHLGGGLFTEQVGHAVGNWCRNEASFMAGNLWVCGPAGPAIRQGRHPDATVCRAAEPPAMASPATYIAQVKRQRRLAIRRENKKKTGSWDRSWAVS
jgi:hypothetical protein